MTSPRGDLCKAENGCLLKAIANQGKEDEFTCSGFRKNNCKLFLFYVMGLLTAGFVFLLGYWYPDRKLRLTHDCCDLTSADAVVIETKDHQKFVSNVFVVRTDIFDNKGHPENKASPIFQFITSKFQFGRINVCFDFMFLRYCWNSSARNFNELSGLGGSFFNDLITENSAEHNLQGLLPQERNFLQQIFGPNIINVPAKSYVRIFCELAADPFYVFQAFSCALWFSDDYIAYASAILFVSMLSLLISTYQTRKHLVTLQNMVSKTDIVEVFPQGNIRDDKETVTVDSSLLVPGDIIAISAKQGIFHCDAILIHGTCAANESMLTGESVPVTKVHLDKAMKNESSLEERAPSNNELRRYTIFNGTFILQANGKGKSKCHAIVNCTGFSTLKGRLIRNIIYPKPVAFHFFRDSMRFLAMLAIVAACGFVYSVVIFVDLGIEPGYIVKKALDVLTIVIPPALPAAMGIGIVFASRRLQNNDIFTIDHMRINVSGKLKLFCFDKTGTLTEDHIMVHSVLSATNDVLSSPAYVPSSTESQNLINAMASCHCLIDIDGELMGDPIDKELFTFTGWKLKYTSETDMEIGIPDKSIVTVFSAEQSQVIVDEKNPNIDDEIQILKQFPFDPALKRMSVIVWDTKSSTHALFVKGAPETIKTICSSSSLPSDFDSVLEEYSRMGLRIIAVAWKNLGHELSSARSEEREQFEMNVDFLGFVTLQNELKAGTKPVIKSLYDADIRTVMVTGDNLLTAVSVAGECGILQADEKVIEVSNGDNGIEFKTVNNSSFTKDFSTVSMSTKYDTIFKCGFKFVLTGETFDIIREAEPILYTKILVCGQVFARMAPNQKATLVEDLKKLGYCVGMCGDGANDCGALKAAHVGISLSEAEASVASPFTSKTPDISCVPKLIAEGRAALVTSFTCFKYMALYSLVQFTSVLVLYSIRSNLSDYEFLYIDLGLVVPLVGTLVITKAYPSLSKERPPGRLFHPVFMFSVFSQIALQLVFQLTVFFYVKRISWYKLPSSFDNTGNSLYYRCYENVTVFGLSAYMYIFLSAVFTKGAPFRQPLYKNIWYIIALIATTTWSTFIFVYPGKAQQDVFKLADITDDKFKALVLAIALGYVILAFILEKFIQPLPCLKRVLNILRGKAKPKNIFKHIQEGIASSPEWPPS